MSPIAYRMHVHTGPDSGTRIELSKDVTALGRDVTNDVVLADAEVSRRHARITIGDSGAILEDLGSTNGSFVNGERLLGPRLLEDGDLIGFGESVKLVFEAREALAVETRLSSQPQAAAAERRPPKTAPPPVAVPAVPPVAAAPRTSRSWLFAGCGCLLMVLAIVGVLFYLDAYYPRVLYDPVLAFLRWIGIQ